MRWNSDVSYELWLRLQLSRALAREHVELADDVDLPEVRLTDLVRALGVPSGELGPSLKQLFQRRPPPGDEPPFDAMAQDVRALLDTAVEQARASRQPATVWQIVRALAEHPGIGQSAAVRELVRRGPTTELQFQVGRTETTTVHIEGSVIVARRTEDSGGTDH